MFQRKRVVVYKFQTLEIKLLNYYRVVTRNIPSSFKCETRLNYQIPSFSFLLRESEIFKSTVNRF